MGGGTGDPDLKLTENSCPKGRWVIQYVKRTEGACKRGAGADDS
jgi:hypothetical protein